MNFLKTRPLEDQFCCYELIFMMTDAKLDELKFPTVGYGSIVIFCTDWSNMSYMTLRTILIKF